MNPLVSVIIPAYNAAGTIGRAIDSALTQTYAPIEVVVIDDCSRDKTAEIVSTYVDGRVRLLRLPENRGESGAMNAGIEVAGGEFIAFLDADDEWLPSKLEIQVPVLVKNCNAAMVTCGFRVSTDSTQILIDWGVPPPGLRPHEIWRGLLAASYVAKPCVVTRASTLREVGPFDPSLRIGADQDMWIRLAMKGEVEFIPTPLTITHDTPGSLTKVYATETDRFVLPMIERHLQQRKHDLSKGEVRHILAVRYTSIGRHLYRNGVTGRGALLLLKAILLREFVAENLLYLITASPMARAFKRRLVSFGHPRARYSLN